MQIFSTERIAITMRSCSECQISTGTVYSKIEKVEEEDGKKNKLVIVGKVFVYPNGENYLSIFPEYANKAYIQADYESLKGKLIENANFWKKRYEHEIDLFNAKCKK